MFRNNIKSNSNKSNSNSNAPVDITVVDSPPSSTESLEVIERLEDLTIGGIVSAKKCANNCLGNQELKHNCELTSRIGADSISQCHKEILRLDANKRKLINESYIKMKAGGVKNILKVFIRLFAENPDYKNIWPQFRAITDSSLISSDELRNHARIYLGGMSALVDSMNSKDEIEFRNIVRRMARSHAKSGVHKYHVMAMIPEYIVILEKAGVEITPEIREAWTTLFDVIGNLLSRLK